MKLIKQSTYSYLQNELNEFVVLCKSQNYRPIKDDFDDIIKFLLLYQSGTTTLCESVEVDSFLIDYLYESLVIERGGDEDHIDREQVYDDAVDAAGKAAKTAVAGAAGAGALALTGVKGVSSWISYLFKKGKVTKAVNDELSIELERLKEYEQLYQIKVKKWKLEGEKGDKPKAEIPGISAKSE